MNQKSQIGKHLVQLNEVDSTNDFAKKIVSKSKPIEGTAILAQNQSAGKGQIGKKWQSEPDKNLTVSIILFPEFLPLERIFMLNQMTSLAILDLLDEYDVQNTSVKWPNDIMIGGKKAAGILTENQISGKKLSTSIIGIGFNVNQRTFDHDLKNASSLSLAVNKEFDLDVIQNRIFNLLNKRYNQLKGKDHRAMEEEYSNRLFRKGVKTVFATEAEQFEGRISGVAFDGTLLIETDSGKRAFQNGQVRFADLH